MEKIENSLEAKKQVKKLPAARRKAIQSLPSEEIDRIEGLIRAIEAAGVQEFTEYIRSPWKMFWPNFFAGMMRGFGALLWVALVLAGIGWIFAITIDLPLIGKRLEPYVNAVQNDLNRYIQQTNYEDEFIRMQQSLEAIEKNTAPKP